MIMVDTSVWIDHLRGRDSLAHVRRLRVAFGAEPIIVGDLILLEVLQGAADEQHASIIERNLRAFAVERMLDDRLAVEAARNYRALRSLGITVRKTIDVIIGTFCITQGCALLHNDSDFEPMHAHLGLLRA